MIEQLRDYGLSQLNAGNAAASAIALKLVCRKRPSDVLAHKAYGAALGQTQQYRAAIVALEMACAGAPDDIESRCMLGEALTMVLDHARAFEQFKVCLKLDPKSEHPYGVRARLLIRRQQRALEEAMKS